MESSSHNRLEEALATLITSQATLSNSLATLISNQAAFVAHIREIREEMTFIRRKLDQLEAILLRHEQILQELSARRSDSAPSDHIDRL